MCLAIPGLVKKVVDKKNAIVEFTGVEKNVATDLLEKVKVGDYVIVHAGFAINRLSKEEALETIKYLV
jgi:hydrogenase expression/formation protein HypC